MLVLQAAREVVEEAGFDDLLDSVRDRVDEIESLHRTRELTVRFRFQISHTSTSSSFPLLCFASCSFGSACLDLCVLTRG